MGERRREGKRSEGRREKERGGGGVAAAGQACRSAVVGVCCPLLATPTTAGRSPHLLLGVLEGDHQHHITSLKLQLIRVSGHVVVLGLHLQRLGESSTPLPPSPLVPPAT